MRNQISPATPETCTIDTRLCLLAGSAYSGAKFHSTDCGIAIIARQNRRLPVSGSHSRLDISIHSQFNTPPHLSSVTRPTRIYINSRPLQLPLFSLHLPLLPRQAACNFTTSDGIPDALGNANSLRISNALLRVSVGTTVCQNSLGIPNILVNANFLRISNALLRMTVGTTVFQVPLMF